MPLSEHVRRMNVKLYLATITIFKSKMIRDRGAGTIFKVGVLMMKTMETMYLVFLITTLSQRVRQHRQHS